MNLKAKSSKLSKKAHLKINSLFRDKNFVGFILVLFLFYIIFYNHLDNDIKKKIFNTVSNPFVLLFSIALCGCILYVNFTLGMIFVFTLIISLTLNTSSDSFTATSSSNLSIEEGFTTPIPTQIPIPLLDNYKKKKRSNKEDVLEGFKSKNFLESKIEQLTNDLEEGLKENDAIEEKYKNTLNKEEFASTNSDDESQKDKKNKHSKKEHYSSNNNNKNNKNNNNNKKEKTIKKRTFDFTNKEDKSLVYTREVLKEVVNRINYEYEDKDYLKKYIGSKFEEIIDLLGLLDDE
jgi:hypothetical protein